MTNERAIRMTKSETIFSRILLIVLAAILLAAGVALGARVFFGAQILPRKVEWAVPGILLLALLGQRFLLDRIKRRRDEGGR
jgi:hypothetical protein